MTVKLGDRVTVGNYQMPIFVERIYHEDKDGNECFAWEAARTMLRLDWGTFGKSKVALHDHGKVWHLYQELN